MECTGRSTNTTSTTQPNRAPSSSFLRQKAPHLVDNDTGGWISGPIIRDKLSTLPGMRATSLTRDIPEPFLCRPQQMLSGDLSGSPTPIYDPTTGNPDGTGQDAFPGNKIPAGPNQPGRQDHDSLCSRRRTLAGFRITSPWSRRPLYNLHKIDTKIDYQVTPKLRVSGRYGYQPYFNQQTPFFGQFLGGSSGAWPAFSANGAGNYLQNGATLAVSGSVTYLFSPTLIIDGTFGVTQPHQLLFPTMTNVKVGLDTLGIPGTNIGALPWSGGMPNFDIGGYLSSDRYDVRLFVSAA